MITKTVFLPTIDNGTLEFGYMGENNHVQFEIRCDSIFHDYPGADASLLIKSPDGTVYPKTVTVDSPSVLFIVTSEDTALNGNGQLQLTFTNDGEIIKSAKAETVIYESLKE